MLSRAGEHVLHVAGVAGELPLGYERRRAGPTTSSPLACQHLQQGGALALGVMTTGELSLSLTTCSTRESRPDTSLGQHSRADPGGGGVQANWPQGVSMGSWPHRLFGIVRKGEMSPHPLPSTAGKRSGSYPYRKAGPASHLLQHSGGQALRCTLAAQ